MKLYKNYNLRNIHSFAVNVNSTHYYSCCDENELQKLLSSSKQLLQPILILGKGNNILFTKNFEGTIIHIQTKGIKKLKETAQKTYISAKAGVDWDDFVKYCILQNLYGAENLSYIPGTVGAAPVQNIGAYGSEVKDIISKVHTLETKTGNIKIFSNNECKFEYRNSIFKSELKEKFIITQVDFVLKKEAELNTKYGDIEEKAKQYSELNLKTVREIIINIRKNKLPEPEIIPNAGSFFKNPVVTKKHFLKLKSKFPELVSYKLRKGSVKLAAGQLIDLSGYKGYKTERAGVHSKQALVLINHNNATGKDIMSLAAEIQKKIKLTFEVELQPEVQIY